MTDNSNLSNLKILVAGAGITFIFTIISYFIMFFFRILSARYFSLEDLGLYTFSSTVLKFCLLFAGLGIGAGITRYLPIYKSRNKKLLSGYLGFIFKYPLIASIIMSLILFFFADKVTIFFNFPSDLTFFLRLVAIAIPFNILSNILRNIFLAEKRIIYSIFSVNILETLVLLIGMLIIMFFKLNIYYLIYFYIASLLTSALFDFFIYKTKIRLPLSEVKEYLVKEWFYFSLPLLMTGALALVISWSDNLFISKLLGPGELAVYSITFSFAMLLLFFRNAFSGIFTPLISESYSKNDHQGIAFLFKKSSAWIFGLSFPIFLVMILYSKQILGLIYGSKYIVGSTTLRILSVGVLFNFTLGFGQKILILHKKTTYTFYVNTLIAILNIILNLLFVPLWGIEGAAISSALSIFMQSFLFFFLARRYEKLRLDYKYLLKFIIAGLPSILLAARILRLGLNVYLSLVLSLLAYGILYLFLLLLFRTFTKEDLDIVIAFEKRLGLNLKFLKKMVKKFY